MGHLKEMHEPLPNDDGALPQAVRRLQALGGRVEDHPEGIYTLRLRIEGRLIYRQIGTSPDAAYIAKLKLEIELRKKARAHALATAVVQVVPESVPPIDVSIEAPTARKKNPSIWIAEYPIGQLY